jgi:hypothetical protein
MKIHILSSAIALATIYTAKAQTINEVSKPKTIAKVTVFVPSASLMCPHLGRMLKQNFPNKTGVSNLVISKDYKYAYFDITAERLNNKDSVLRMFNELGGYPISEIKEIVLEKVKN